MPREKEAKRLWGKASFGLGICLVETTGISSGTVELFLVGRLLWLKGDCWWCMCGNPMEINPLGKQSKVRVARAGAWRPRSSHKNRIGYLPWLMSCWLLWLTSGERGEHLCLMNAVVQDMLRLSFLCLSLNLFLRNNFSTSAYTSFVTYLYFS